MASHAPMIRMNENVHRAPGKTQAKTVRKVLGDLTNSSRPQTNSKAPTKKVGGLNTRGKLQPKVGRKPLCDLTNSTKPVGKARSPKKKNVRDVRIHSDVHEGFCHNHKECIYANNQYMSVDYFLETVGLQKEASVAKATPKVHASFTTSKFKSETPLKYLDDEIDLDASKFCGSTPAGKSPMWNMDMKDLEFSGFKLKGDFSGFKMKGEFSDFKLKESY